MIFFKVKEFFSFGNGIDVEIFKKEYFENNLDFMRSSIIIGMLIYCSFIILDFTIAGENIRYFYFIRFGILAIYALIIYFLSFKQKFIRDNIQAFFSLAIIICGIGTLTMTMLSIPEYKHLYYAGTILIIFYNYVASRMSFSYTISAGTTICMIYIILAIFFEEIEKLIFFHYTFNFLVANSVGAFASFTMEKQARVDFSRRKEVEEKNKELKDLSTKDPLTGLYNLRFLHKRIKEAISIKDRNKNINFSGIFLDLDNFKKVNDTCGHDAGDQLLKLISQELLKLKRESDLIARLGGDEFFILVNGDLKSAIDFSTRINKIFEIFSKEIEKIFKKNKKCKISFSIGCAELKSYMRTPDELIKESDNYMYISKNSGKGVISFSE